MSQGLVNATSYAAVDVPLFDPDGHHVVVAIVKATFEVDRTGRVRPADQPSEVRFDDILHDPKNPRSSARYPSELCDEKVGTDVVIVGEAISKKPVGHVDVAVKIRGQVAPLVVHGLRLFYRSLKGMGDLKIGPAAPFERKPIVYDDAYGGMALDGSIVEERNPSGVGIARRAADLDGQPAPQIEHPARPHASPDDDHPPVGYGSLLTHWSPRKEHAGTFDKAWQEGRMPLLPVDFDRRYYNVAHPSLQFSPHLHESDSIAILGMTESGLMSFALPALPIVIIGRSDRSGMRRVRPPVDTVLIEPSRGRVELTVRASFPMGRGGDVLREIRIDSDER